MERGGPPGLRRGLGFLLLPRSRDCLKALKHGIDRGREALRIVGRYGSVGLPVLGQRDDYEAGDLPAAIILRGKIEESG
jgi:hypothetical protein